MNAQIILRPNGDFVTRSNDVETVCRRVNPDDWDDDGIANERDANPTTQTFIIDTNGTVRVLKYGHEIKRSTDGKVWLDGLRVN